MSPPRVFRAPLLCSAALQLGLLALLGGRLHPDEVHQGLEPAHRLAFGYGNRAHEWHLGLRNWVAPALLAGPQWLAGHLLSHALAPWAASTAALLCWTLLGQWAAQRAALAFGATRAQQSLLAWSLALCAPLADAGPRALSETWSLAPVALALWALARERALWAGVALGASFLLRYPSGLFLLGPLLHFALRRELRSAARLLLGFALPALALGALDALSWGSPWHSLLAYARFNVLGAQATAHFGARPWWYLWVLAAALGPAGLLLLALPWRGSRGSVTAGALVLAYLVPFTAVAHKEWRFVLPALLPLTVFAVLSRRDWSPRRAGAALAVSAAQGVLLASLAWRSGHHQGAVFDLVHAAAREPSLRELWVFGATHPGFAHVHRRVRIEAEPTETLPPLVQRLDAAPRAEGRAAVCFEARAPGCVAALRERGAVVRREQGGAVWLEWGPHPPGPPLPRGRGGRRAEDGGRAELRSP